MNWIDTNTLIAICTCAIGLTQFLFWRYIAKQKSYESEKGRNLATKEDIGEITKEIKSVESKFINETEKLKAELALLTNIKTGIFSEKRNIIIDLHAAIHKWMQSAIYSDLTNLSDNESINKGIHTTKMLYNDLLIKEAMFKIYIENKDLRHSIYNINNSGLDCMKLKTNLYFDLISINNEIQYCKDTKNHSGMEIMLKKRKDTLDKYHIERKEVANDYFELIANFEDQCRIYISECIK